MTREQVIEQIRLGASVVSGWPSWKQNALTKASQSTKKGVIMHKIKLIKMYFSRGSESYYYDIDSYSCSNIYDEMSDWEEVSDEDFKYLQSSEGQKLLQGKNVKMIVLEDITNKDKVSGFVKDIKKAIVESKELEAKRKKKEEEQKAKRELAAIERKIKNAKKILEKSGLKVINE